LQVANCLLYEKVTIIEDITIIKHIFEDMLCEAIDNYTSLFEILPLENLNSWAFVSYLPPGRNQKILQKAFWCKVRSLVSRETFEQLFMDDRAKIYERIAVEYCYDLDMPGKALVILRDALQTKLVNECNDSSFNLFAIALEAAERAIFNQKIKPLQANKEITTLPDERKERIMIFFGASGIKGPFEYFKETKWIFTLSKRLYERYLAELRWFL